MAWHHRLIAAKYTAKRQSTTEQQKKMAIIRELWIKLAEENPDWVTADPIVHGFLNGMGFFVCTATVHTPPSISQDTQAWWSSRNSPAKRQAV
jgi:hypothetical protein